MELFQNNEAANEHNITLTNDQMMMLGRHKMPEEYSKVINDLGLILFGNELLTVTPAKLDTNKIQFIASKFLHNLIVLSYLPLSWL